MNGAKFRQDILPLTQKIYPMVYRMLGNKEDAHDAVQEVMLKLWDKRKQLNNHPNVTGFVLLTAKNHCLDLLKKRHPLFVNAADYESADHHNSQKEIEWKELNGIIREMLMELPESQREVLAMRDLDGLEYSEIADTTGLKIEHVRVLLSRARKQIGSKLKKIYSYE
ncbi:RNA polymerase sigma factor [Marinoscillum sp.]|uniref:RNA polymerase sigma factor n=1 Tax=Marinoscillum sp. TaxID=2024838 RepID=UPI003BA924D8